MRAEAAQRLAEKLGHLRGSVGTDTLHPATTTVTRRPATREERFAATQIAVNATIADEYMARPKKSLGECRNCSRRVMPAEGHMVHGRAEHHDCDTAIARMDAARTARGQAPVTGRAPQTAASVIAAGERRPRTWDERTSSSGGGTSTR